VINLKTAKALVQRAQSLPTAGLNGRSDCNEAIRLDQAHLSSQAVRVLEFALNLNYFGRPIDAKVLY
jgi:hypothetical protein